jgi:hypothetical protein
MDDGNKFKVLKLETNDIDFESFKIKVIITYFRYKNEDKIFILN